MKKNLYSSLLYLYPEEFRHEFGDELLVVFTAKCEDARQSGWFDLVVVWFREIIEFPGNLLTEYWLQVHGRKSIGGFEMGIQPDKKAVVTVVTPLLFGIALWIMNPPYMNKLFSTMLGLLFLSCVVLILAVNTFLILGFWKKSRLWIGLLAVVAVMIIMFAPAFLHLIASEYIASSIPGTVAFIALMLCDIGLLIALVWLSKNVKSVQSS